MCACWSLRSWGCLMSDRRFDLDFALDGLYACGWWPGGGDGCDRAEDGRWYPSEAMVLQSFAAESIGVRVRESLVSDAVEVVWDSRAGGHQVTHGRSRAEALILAFTSLQHDLHAIHTH